jgi:hypothetical protein
LTLDEELEKSKTVRVINHSNTRFKPEVVQNSKISQNSGIYKFKKNEDYIQLNQENFNRMWFILLV